MSAAEAKGTISTEEFQAIILGNFRETGRTFPWRETSDPYHIMVSEFMLQQTQTERVVPKYTAWLERFPTIQSLASASFASVLEQWAGLGYNRRARFLHESAKIVCERFSGQVPDQVEELDSLPGIGPYTARAIATFSHNRPNVFIETNIRSVYIFFFFKESSDPVSDKDILRKIEETLDFQNPRIWYYALMDYGVLLKKKTVNPNRKSLHYSKQSAFSGSLRQARGAALRCIGKLKEATIEEISSLEGIDRDRVYRALAALEKEGFVAESGGKYRIFP